MTPATTEKAPQKALDLAGYKQLRKKQATMRKKGKLLGIGLSTYVEICGMGPARAFAAGGGWRVRRYASSRRESDVLSGSSPHRQVRKPPLRRSRQTPSRSRSTTWP